MHRVCPCHEELVENELQSGARPVQHADQGRSMPHLTGGDPTRQLNRMKTKSKAARLSSENPRASILCFSHRFSSYCSSSSVDRLVDFLVISLTIGIRVSVDGQGERRCRRVEPRATVMSWCSG
jgi:hypothetical protein